MISVRDFYKDKTIFITGGSGFMGKVLIEKLLRSCPDLKQILILMRPKRGKTAKERLEEFAKIPLFEKIMSENPEVMKKLTPVYGDISEENLGLSNDDLSLMLRETNVVFHFAATLDFEAPIKTAVQMNIRGLDYAINLAKQMKKLKVFVHLSTAFCNPDQEVMKEKVYDFDMQPRLLMDMMDNLKDETINSIEKTLIASHPNTYTYTKRVGELLVRDEFENLPICIVRPSIVWPTYKEPVAGWVDNMNGPIGLLAAGSKGILRSALVNGSTHMEMIPCDFAINGIIIFTAKNGMMKEKPTNVPVYNLTIKPENRATWQTCITLAFEAAKVNPMNIGLWYPDASLTMSPIKHYTRVFFLQWIPALMIDLLMMIFLQKPVFVRLQKKIFMGMKLLKYFAMKKWDFRNEQDWKNEVNEVEGFIFPTDDEKFDVFDYMKEGSIGLRLYIFKEKLSDLPKARRQLKIFRVIDFVARIGRLVFLAWMLNTLSRKFFGFDVSNLF